MRSRADASALRGLRETGARLAGHRELRPERAETGTGAHETRQIGALEAGRELGHRLSCKWQTNRC